MSLKEEWSIEKRERFEDRLEKLGWRRDGCWFYRGVVAIETDNFGVFIWEKDLRRFGLSDDSVDAMTWNQLGPLAQDPFEKEKRYIWLDLITGIFTDKRIGG